MNDHYKIYAEDLDTGDKRYIGRGFGDARGLIDLYATECEPWEEVVLVDDNK